MGNLVRDVELRYTPNGKAVCDISVAVNDRKKVDGEWVEDTTFVDVTLWARNAEVAAEYLGKGSLVFIDGRLKLDKWESQEGDKRSKLKVVGERMQMLNKVGESKKPEGPVSTPNNENENTNNEDGEIPF
jgi:single-strand DNA-binding protein